MAKFERIIPILVYEDIPSTHDFLVQAFGFVSGGVQRTRCRCALRKGA